jgi:hypothetical protein
LRLLFSVLLAFWRVVNFIDPAVLHDRSNARSILA